MRHWRHHHAICTPQALHAQHALHAPKAQNVPTSHGVSSRPYALPAIGSEPTKYSVRNRACASPRTYRLRYAMTHTGYCLRGLTAIARALGVSRNTLIAWIRDAAFPAAPIEDEDGRRRMTSTYGLIDAWVFAYYLASREDLLRVLAPVSFTERDVSMIDLLAEAAGVTRRQRERHAQHAQKAATTAKATREHGA